MKRETKKPLPRAFVGWYIFVFTHKRSSAEIHRVFLFPRMIEHLSRLPTLMRYKHLAGGLESIRRHETKVLDTERDRWDSREGGGLALNMYWLWIEVKCRDPGCRHDRGFSAPCLGRILASITRSSSSSRRASEELSRQQHEIKHRRSYLGSTRSTIPGPSSTREPVQGFLQASMQPLDLPQHEQHNFHCCSSLLPSFLFKQPLDLPTWKTAFPSMFIAVAIVF